MSELLNEMVRDIYTGDRQSLEILIDTALGQGYTAAEILNNGLIPGMDRVGQDFRDGILFTPEVLISARAMQHSLEMLRPTLAKGGLVSAGKCVIGTVKGDMHDIGKNLVGTMLEGAGFDVIDLGTDVSPQSFVAAARMHKPELIGMSALLTTTMPFMQEAIHAINKAGVRNGIQIMIGGAPVTEEYAQSIGADGYAQDAALAVEMARKMMGNRI